MKIEAKQRLTADELSPKQKAIDFNDNGKVDGEDLKQLREGKEPVEAAFLTRGLKKKFYADLRKALQKVGYENRLYDQVVGSQAVVAFDHPPDSQFFAAMKKLGWVKKKVKLGFTFLTRADGTWPISLWFSKNYGYCLNVKSDDGEFDGRRSQK